jgi:hypothetical protein
MIINNHYRWLCEIMEKKQNKTSIQLTSETRDILKKLGRMDDDWETLLKRIGNQYIPIDDDMDRQLNEISKKYGINRKLLGTIGLGIIIFLENSGILRQLQGFATLKNKSISAVISEFLKFKFKKGG